MLTLTLKIPAHLSQRLAATARRRGVSRSRLVREAIEHSLQGDEDGTGTSCLDLVRDLVGCHTGPPDLSSSKEHMKGYGR